MKQKTIVLLLCLLALLCLNACSASGPGDSPSASGSPSVPDGGGVTLSPSAGAETTELSDFLTEEQIRLLQTAEDFYLSTFGWDYSEINRWVAAGEDAPPPEEETIEQNGIIYCAGYGRFAKWEDFDCYVHTLFTDQCWKERNERSGFPIYIGYNGRMYYIDAAMGGGGHNYHIPDLYRLEEKTDDAISFTVTGHYLLRSTCELQEGETPEERDRRIENSFDYTLEFPIQLVLTADGWRLNRFASTRSSLDAEAAMIAAGMLDRFLDRF